MIELDKIYNEDCLIGMRNIPDNYIDCIICDLPYGTTQNTWDSIIPLDELWEQYKRICKPNAAIILFSQQPFTAKLIMSNIDMFRYEWIWEKDNSTGFLNAKQMPLKIHENILLFYKKLPTYNPIMRQGFKPYFSKRKKPYSSNYNWYNAVSSESEDGSRYPIDIIQFNKDNSTFHPTQKPVKLIEYLITTYTNEGDIVLDNCSGSGTTAVAAWREKRHFICLKRLKNEMMQQMLF